MLYVITKNKKLVMILEDDTDLAEGIELSLQDEELNFIICKTIAEARKALGLYYFDLLIVDINLPDGNGLELCRELKKKIRIPVALLTAKVMEIDIVKGLESGADDYITKPFNPLEVAARVKTQLRRYRLYNHSAAEQGEPAREYDIRGLVINRDSHKCFLFGNELQLTPIEFAILWYLCERQGVVVPSEELFEAVWGEKFLQNNNTVMAHIGRLREKMGEPARNPRFIKTVWGVGYIIEK